MNTIFFSKRYEFQRGRFVIPFSTHEIEGINTDCRPHERTDTENRLLGCVADRITLALQNRGFEVVGVNFRNMAITAMKTEVL